MIILDFQVDEEELENCLAGIEDGIENIDSGCFVTTMFLMPLRMCLTGLEIFKINEKNCWSQGPIMDLATLGLMAIRELKWKKKDEHQIIEGPGDFVFTMIGDEDVYVEFTRGYAITVKYDALLEAFEKYSEKVRNFLKVRAPQINDHPYWGPWLRGERECKRYLA